VEVKRGQCRESNRTQGGAPGASIPGLENVVGTLKRQSPGGICDWNCSFLAAAGVLVANAPSMLLRRFPSKLFPSSEADSCAINLMGECIGFAMPTHVITFH
jgi:hypothetical protein